MAQSKIIQIFQDISNNQMKIDTKICDKEFNNLLKWEEIFLKQIGNDKKIKRIYQEYIKALSTYYAVMFEQYYREGFICGAQVELEICGISISN